MDLAVLAAPIGPKPLMGARSRVKVGGEDWAGAAATVPAENDQSPMTNAEGMTKDKGKRCKAAEESVVVSLRRDKSR